MKFYRDGKVSIQEHGLKNRLQNGRHFSSALSTHRLHPILIIVHVYCYIMVVRTLQEPFYYHGLTLIPAGISNFNHNKMWQ